MKQFLLDIVIWLDEGVNVILIGILGLFVKIPVPSEGNPHYTVSQVLGFLRQRGERIGCIGCHILTWVQNHIFRITGDHCAQALEGMPDDITSG